MVMTNMQRIMLKAYIGGYLNTYYVERTTLSLSSEGYKRFRRFALFAYIKKTYHPDSILDNFFCATYSLIEPYVSILVVICSSVLHCIKLCLKRRCNTTLSRRKIIYDIGEPKLDKMLKDASIEHKDVVLIIPPEGTKYDRSIYTSYSIYNYLTFKDIWNNLILSVRTIVLLWQKYGDNDPFFRSYSCYSYYLAFCCLRYLANDNVLVYFSTYNRWALMIKEMKCKKIFIQHGIIGSFPFLIKCGRVDCGFFISKNQTVICEKYLFKEIGEIRLQKSIKINNDKLLNNGKVNILIVCHSKFMQQEIKYASLLAGGEYNIYLKYHPLESRVPYDILASKTNAIVLDKADFIEADIVIGYQSTLMEEYANIGVPVYYYSDMDFDSVIDKLINI